MAEDKLPPLSAIDRLDVVEAVGGILLHVDGRDWDKAKALLLRQVTTDCTSVMAGRVTTL